MDNNDIIFILGMGAVIGFLSLFIYHEITMPPNPMYISSNLFPIIVNTSSYASSQSPYTVYVFNGIKQANNTECISNVQISRYVFNYTIQKYQMAWNESITDPSQVYEAYNKIKSYYNAFPISSPNGYAPLCPNIVNATT
jgi:hypothetical protein